MPSSSQACSPLSTCCATIRRTVTPVEIVEQAIDTLFRLSAEEVGEVERMRVAFAGEGVRANAGRSHRENLRSDIDATEQDELTALELRAEPHHRMEQTP